MSHAIRPTLAALLGAAALAATSAASAQTSELKQSSDAHVAPALQSARTMRATTQLGEGQAEEVCDAASPATLRSIIETRAAAAEKAGRYDQVDELTSLWLTLERRQQLDRVVQRGEQFVNVSLRNQKRSEQRSASRAIRRSAADPAELDLPTFSLDVGQALDAEAFVASLDEPYRSAVRFSLSGMNHREVAEQMGASHSAVRKWAQRLRDRLENDQLSGKGWGLSA